MRYRHLEMRSTASKKRPVDLTLTPPGLRAQSYLVRLWVEPDGGDGTANPRGYVKYLSTGAETYFSSTDELPELLRSHICGGGRNESEPRDRSQG